jgi:hypothetical protein
MRLRRLTILLEIARQEELSRGYTSNQKQNVEAAIGQTRAHEKMG